MTPDTAAEPAAWDMNVDDRSLVGPR